jgi:hypothetical protein
VQLWSCRSLNHGTLELYTSQGERHYHQDVALTIMCDYRPEHGAKPLTQQHVLLPRCVSLISAYVLGAHCFGTGRICGLGQCECDAKSHGVGPPVGTILHLPGLWQHLYYTSYVLDMREDAIIYALHLCSYQFGSSVQVAFDIVL